MSPSIPTAKLTLKYPIYASAFDPSNSDFLYVGGGGGEGRSGVKNKIALIDTSKRSEINEIIDIELSANEDSVQSLAVAQSQADSAVVFAGINSSAAEQEKGINEHLRSFSLRYPAKRRRTQNGEKAAADVSKDASPTIQGLSKAALFTPSDAKTKETYQRILRLTKQNSSSKPLGVVATGLAPDGEIVVFEAAHPRPDKRDIRQRLQLGKGKEAADVDVVAAGDAKYLVAYSDDHEIYLSQLSGTPAVANEKPVSIYEAPAPTSSKGAKLKLRFVRFLSPQHLIVVVNFPAWGGAELVLLEIAKDGESSTALLRKTLHKRIKAATSFAIAELPPPSAEGITQHVVAIGGQDLSLTILTIDIYAKTHSTPQFRQHSLQKDLHPTQMTSLAFSTFTSPTDPIKAAPQYLKLASTSISSTVVVLTLPLTPYPSPVAKRRPGDSPVRYTLIPPKPVKGQTPLGISAIIAIVLVAISAFLLQTVIEIRGVTPEILGAKDWLSDSLREKIALPWMFDENPVLTDSLPPIRSGVSKAYEAVKDSLPDDAEGLQEAVEEPVRQVRKAAGKVKDSALDHHRRLRNILSRRAEHLSTQLTGGDDEDEDEDIPLFSDVFGEEHPDVERDYQSDASSEVPQRALVISDDSSDDEHALSTELHHAEEDLVQEGKVRKWEDLKKHEQQSWLRKLEDAGIWAADEGEVVLKGIFFSQLGGLVAEAVRG